jgi:hypothetical protein
MQLPRPTLLILFLLALAVTAGELRAQAVPGEAAGQQGGLRSWAPPSFGVRLGWDQRQREEMLGGQVRIPIVPSGVVEVMGSADVTFLLNLKEYQYNLEAVYVLDGRAGGLYGGAGLGFRNSIYPGSVRRTTDVGYTAVAGFRLVGLGLIVPQLEYRWIFINDAPFNYQTLAIGVNLALWRPVNRN